MKKTLLSLILVSSPGEALPLVAQQPTENWIGVAQRIGGAGVARDGRYVLLVPSRGWNGATPPAWIEFRPRAGMSVVRGTIPVLRSRAASAVAVLRSGLTGAADIDLRDTYGADSERVHVRFLAEGTPEAMAGALRRAFEHIEPGALARIDTTGVVEEDSFECEKGLVLRTAGGERVDVGELPTDVAREGVHVRLLARRRYAGHRRFLYYGVNGDWRTVATLDRLEACPKPDTPPVGERGDGARWFVVCRTHARSLLDSDGHGAARLDRPLASGFDRMTDPGFPLCPQCQRALVKDWLFADTAHDRVDATLSCCVEDGLYFLGRDGFHHGPFFPDLDHKEEKR